MRDKLCIPSDKETVQFSSLSRCLLIALIFNNVSIWVSSMEFRNALAKICHLSCGILASWHKMVMIGVLLIMCHQCVLPNFKGEDTDTCCRQGSWCFKGQHVTY